MRPPRAHPRVTVSECPCFVVQNSIDEAVALYEKGVYAASPGAGEEQVYATHAALLRLAGAEVGSSEPSAYLGLPLALSPAIALTPRFALTVDDVLRHVRGGAAVRVSGTSTLILDGDVTLSSLDLDGALRIRAGPGVRIEVLDCRVRNEGWRMRPTTNEDAVALPEAITIRGYAVEKLAAVEVDIDEPGAYQLTGEGELRKL